MSSSSLPPSDQKRLDDLFAGIQADRLSFVGYPCNANLDYHELLKFLDYPVNNVGDPFVPSTYRLHSRELELDVVQWFAELFHAPKDNYWGYMTNGGTEGNMYGLYLARELHPEGFVYYSQDTHYSVAKILRLLKMRHIMIKSQPNGEIDYEDLRETIKIHRDRPPIIFANIGTTMKEAVDDVPKIRKIITDLAIPSYYIHSDGALAGMTLPFVEGAPAFDFSAGIDSISVSGHKFIGSPIPCGIVLAKKSYVDRIARSIEYVGTLDTTITGSRNGITPIFIWYAIKKMGIEGFREMVADCQRRADYAIAELKEIGIEAWRNHHAITVVLPRLPEDILSKWQIAVNEDHCHIIVMPHISRDVIDRLVADIKGPYETNHYRH